MNLLQESLIQFNNNLESFISEYRMKSRDELRKELGHLKDDFDEICGARPEGTYSPTPYVTCDCPICGCIHKKKS